jgi:hypothetical protein
MARSGFPHSETIEFALRDGRRELHISGDAHLWQRFLAIVRTQDSPDPEHERSDQQHPQRKQKVPA